jgi:hypothetical protein
MQKLITLGLLLSLLMIGLLSSAGTSQSSAQTNTVNQYAAKFVCGKTDGGLAAPGQYFTIINVHNPSPNANINFRKKFALGERDEKVGKKTRFWQASLHADEVMGIDCPNIYKHTGIPEGTFIEGYAVIESRAELDIVCVYTAGRDHVEALHTERVPFRKVPNVPEVCPDLNLSINTGSTPWRITSDPLVGTTEPRAASVVQLSAPDWGSQAGSLWIGPISNAGLVPVSRGDYVYEFSFCLCPGFSNAKLALSGITDDRARVFLNGTLLSPILEGPKSADVKFISATSPFAAGTNTLKVIVNNTPAGLTGLNIKGSITATAGACHEDD